MTKEQATREAYWERVARIKEEMLRVSYEENKLLKEALQQRPQNCGTGYCSCIECVMEPEPVAWMDVHQPWDLYKNKPQLDAVPLYTHPPVPTAQPEQEPVALETVYETIIQWDEGGGKRSRRELARRIVSLYTTPPQRKPLTDDQIADIYRKASGINFYLNFARAIEAAHGIKE